jgi:hypothetical protein
MSAVQHVRKACKGQALRLRAAPENLQRLIELANSIPVDREFPDTSEVLSKAPAGLNIAELRALCLREFEVFPEDQFPAFRNFIGPVKPERLSILSETCDFLRGARETLKAIARLDKADVTGKDIPLPEKVVAFSLGWKTDERGIITMKQGDVSKAIVGVEAARIRLCPVCKRIFWAGRIDQPCCTRGCANVLRVRRYREAYLNQYKQQRYRKSEQLAKGRPRKAGTPKPKTRGEL